MVRYHAVQGKGYAHVVGRGEKHAVCGQNVFGLGLATVTNDTKMCPACTRAMAEMVLQASALLEALDPETRRW